MDVVNFVNFVHWFLTVKENPCLSYSINVSKVTGKKRKKTKYFFLSGYWLITVHRTIVYLGGKISKGFTFFHALINL